MFRVIAKYLTRNFNIADVDHESINFGGTPTSMGFSLDAKYRRIIPLNKPLPQITHLPLLPPLSERQRFHEEQFDIMMRTKYANTIASPQRPSSDNDDDLDGLSPGARHILANGGAKAAREAGMLAIDEQQHDRKWRQKHGLPRDAGDFPDLFRPERPSPRQRDDARDDDCGR